MRNVLFALRASMYLLRADEGGRLQPAFSGYRPGLYIGPRQTDCAIYRDPDPVLPLGQSVDVQITLLHPEALGDALCVEATFVLKEGSRLVGRGVVTELLRA